MAALVEASKEVPKGSEEVLIEIDGKFELVSAADMQAKQPGDPPTPRQEANSTNDQDAIKNGHMKLEKGQESSEAENYDDDDFEDDVSHSSTNSFPSVVATEAAAPPDPKKEEQSISPIPPVDPQPPSYPVSTEPPVDPVSTNPTADSPVSTKPPVDPPVSTEPPVSTRPPVDSASTEPPVDPVSTRPPVNSDSTEPPGLSESKNFAPIEKHNTIAPGEPPSNNSSDTQNNHQSKMDGASETAGLNHSSSSVVNEGAIKKPKSSKPSSVESVISHPHVKPQESSVEIIVSDHDMARPRTDSTFTERSTTEKSRTKSAPSRSTMISQYWEDSETERKQRCESAFKAWLTKKDAQIAEERRLQRANTRIITKQEKLEKIEMCQTAYRAWLENKNRQIHERRLNQRNVKSACTKEPQESAVAFRQWLEQKQIQRRKEREVLIRRQKEEAELAQRVDPSIANQAYRRWLRKKNIEARQEAARRLELQRYYFRQGRLLKESLRERFQGF